MTKYNKLASMMDGKVSDDDRIYIAKNYDDVKRKHDIAYWKDSCAGDKIKVPM